MVLLISKNIVNELNRIFKSLHWDCIVQDSSLSYNFDLQKGDFSFPCFELAKKTSAEPQKTACLIKDRFKKSKEILKIEAVNGYLNFYIDRRKTAPLILKQILAQGKHYGHSDIGKNKKIMVEFSSPNTNKPLHLGHLRNIVIGDSVSNLLESVGFEAVRATLLNDRGIHICKSMLAYDKWGNNKKPDVKSDHFVGEYYVLFEKKRKREPNLDKELSSFLKKLESKDRATVLLWKKMNKWAENGFKETYKKLGVRFDKTYKESRIYEKGKKLIQDLFEKGVFKKDKQGAIFADLEQFGLPNKILLRSDKTAIYITQDIYLAILKFKEYDLAKSIYCVGSEQELYLKQLFKIVQLLGHPCKDKCYHLNHGIVFLPEGKMKSREGKVVDADNLIKELEDLARNEIVKRNPKIKEKELSKRSEKLSLTALKYYLLLPNPARNVYFDPKKSISFIGRTGPYIQYSQARICSILKKAKNVSFNKADCSLFNEKELCLILVLFQFPLIIKKSALDYNPSLLAQYLYDLAESFNNYYENFSVLGADKKTRKARLLLLKCSQTVFSNGMEILGIPLMDKM